MGVQVGQEDLLPASKPEAGQNGTTFKVDFHVRRRAEPAAKAPQCLPDGQCKGQVVQRVVVF